jgi:tripartite-type tricarboxylate transporter receptor subunit TctC
MGFSRRTLYKFALGMGLLTSLPAASAEVPASTWKPDGNMEMVVASGVGTAYDILARAMGRLWPKYFGGSLIVQNVAGAGGGLGVDRVVKSKPDGRTIGFMSTSPYLSESVESTFPWKMQDIPFFLAAATPPYVIVTGGNSPYKTWEDVRKAKKRIASGSTGRAVGDVVHIKDLVDHGVDVTTAVFGGTPATLAAIESGDADIWSSVASISIMEPIKQGQLRPLFIYAAKRYPSLPDVPTHIELGMPEEAKYVNSVRLWFAPPKTPANVLQGLEQRMTALLQDPEIEQWSKDNGLVETILSGAQARENAQGFADILRRHFDIYQKYGGG